MSEELALNPECQQGKHMNCDGKALVGNDIGACECNCHNEAYGYKNGSNTL